MTKEVSRVNQLRVVSGAMVTKRAVYHRMQRSQGTCASFLARTLLPIVEVGLAKLFDIR